MADSVDNASIQDTTPVPSEKAHQGDLGYAALLVRDLEPAAHFYCEVLGWKLSSGSAPEGPRLVTNIGLHHGLEGGHDHPSMNLCFVVDELQPAIERIRAAGGTAEDPDTTNFGTVFVACTDDQGMDFAIYAPMAGRTVERPSLNGVGPGDLAYVTIKVPDTTKARSFLGAVLGLEFQPGTVDDGWAVLDVHPMMGLWGDADATQTTVVPQYRVSDIASAVEKVRALGGTSTEPSEEHYGWSAECTDDQGTNFFLAQL